MQKQIFRFVLLVLLGMGLAACAGGNEPTAVSPVDTAMPTSDAQSTTNGTTAISPTFTPPATPTPLPPTATIAPTVTPPPSDLSITAEDVFVYPVPAIYAGDRVTFQILAHVPETVASDSVTVHILVNDTELSSGTLGWRNLAGDAVGLFEWVWDTSEQVGTHTVEVVLDRNDTIQVGDEDPHNNAAELTVLVQDPEQLPRSEAAATWVSAESNCCLIYTVSGTAAYRDLSDLIPAIEAAFRQASEKLTEPINRKYEVYLIDRVIGQGGYAGSSMVVSYLDRQYASQGLYEVLVHEAVHLLDRQFAPQRITFLAEGLAVWASGGHYKQEDLDQRSAALVQIGRYVPLPRLIDDFYPVQHEIGYLQAAGFVKYLIDKYGWTQFRAFYSDVTYDDADTLSAAVDQNMQTYFGITLAEIESEWLAYLDSLPYDETAVVDLQTTIRYYDTMRRYQRQYDPTAYFLTAWLPYPQDLQKSGNPADLTRHPETEINVTLEVMLQAADTAVRTGNYTQANVILDSIERVLDNDGVFLDPLSTSYLNVVRTAAAQGYEVHKVTLNGDHARVQATTMNSVNLTELTLVLRDREWILSK